MHFETYFSNTFVALPNIVTVYDKLWNYIKIRDKDSITLTFIEIGRIAGVPADHSLLRYKKELLKYGYEVSRISIKEQKVTFEKC